MSNSRYVLTNFVALLISIPAFAHHTVLETPTKKLESASLPVFDDDLGFVNMLQAIDRQIIRFRQRSMNGYVKYGEDIYPELRLLETLTEFKQDVQALAVCKVVSKPADCMSEFRSKVRSKYSIYVPDLSPEDPRYGEDKDTFFTAYYTPTMNGSLQRKASHPYPVFRRPTSEQLARLGRIDIDFEGRLNHTDYDVFYTDDLFELYLLQVQGGGRVRLENGEKFYISYDRTNNQTFRWISQYMMREGYISDSSIASQRRFLKENPHKQREVYSYCPSYVYFRPTDHPPEGSDLVPLTNGRSIATDSRLYRRKGALAFVQAMKPNPETGDNEFVPFSRFMLDQDTGGAIRGKGRVDLFHGEDAYAERAAFNTQHTGNLYFLILK